MMYQMICSLIASLLELINLMRGINPPQLQNNSTVSSDDVSEKNSKKNLPSLAILQIHQTILNKMTSFSILKELEGSNSSIP